MSENEINDYIFKIEVRNQSNGNSCLNLKFGSQFTESDDNGMIQHGSYTLYNIARNITDIRLKEKGIEMDKSSEEYKNRIIDTINEISDQSVEIVDSCEE
jgi:hypothetical protein